MSDHKSVTCASAAIVRSAGDTQTIGLIDTQQTNCC